MKYRNVVCLIILLLQLCGPNTEGQTADTVWEKCYGGLLYDAAYGISQLPDGGYIIGNSSNSSLGDLSDNHGGDDCWIVKLDSSGNTMWHKCYGGTGNETLYDIESCRNGGSIFVGSTTSYDGDLLTAGFGATDAWIVKLDDTGAIQWQLRIGGSNVDIPNSVQQTSDSGYIVLGTTFSTDVYFSGTTDTSGDLFVAKLASNGALSWLKMYGGGGYKTASKILQTKDGGYIFCGSTNDPSRTVDSSYDVWVVKLDDTGAITWQRTYGDTGAEFANDIIQTQDSGYVIAAYTSSDTLYALGATYGSGDAWCLKTDKYGAVQWSKIYGGSSVDEALTIVKRSGGGYIFSGFTFSTDSNLTGQNVMGGGDCWVVCIDDTGAIMWQKVLGGSGFDEATCMVATSDTGCIFAGVCGSGDGDVHGNHGENDSWVVKIKDEKSSGIKSLYNNNQEIKVYPTVSSGLLYAVVPESLGKAQIRLLNLMGQNVPVQYGVQNGKYIVNISDLPQGIYLLQVKYKDGQNIYKIVFRPG